MSLFLPPDPTDPFKVTGPVVFLAGPIQGAPDWQPRATEMFASAPEIHIANPKRVTRFEGEFGAVQYAEQVDWETRWLQRAAREGVILFWLAKEQDQSCERAYAQTTRFELGEWSIARGARVAIGIEPGFTGEKYIRHRLGPWLAYGIRDTLEGTVALAERLIHAGKDL
jgi:hypothetical protein